MERIDHHKGIFKGLPESPQEEAKRRAELPLVSPGLIEHLERVRFGALEPACPPPTGLDGAVNTALSAARAFGQREVVLYLSKLLEEQGKSS